MEKVITFFDYTNLSLIRNITNIDFIDTQDIFFLFQDFIITNFKPGILLISAKTKQIIQFIENFGSIPNTKEIYCDNEESLYISYKIGVSFMRIIKLKMNNGAFEKDKEYAEIETNEKEPKIFGINDEDIIIWGKAVYLLK